MLVDGQACRSIWLADDGVRVAIIDQTLLPFAFEVRHLANFQDACAAIKDMQVRGAPLIGATAAYGLCLGLYDKGVEADLKKLADGLIACRPTAVNLRWAVERMLEYLQAFPREKWLDEAYAEAGRICEEDVQTNASIGRHGAKLIKEIWAQKGKTGPVNVLTHCNAGWLATVDWGTALAPVYAAVQEGISVHVWVDETRPRNQGASLTAWELSKAGIDHHLIADNAGGHLMQHKMVDICIVGSDRTTATGDVCNKIGTYLKALAAQANQVPFYVALPGSTVDWSLQDGLGEIPIEERSAEEVLTIQGQNREDGKICRLALAPVETKGFNPAFDVTPSALVTGLITERGVCPAKKEGLLSLFPEQAWHG